MTLGCFENEEVPGPGTSYLAPKPILFTYSGKTQRSVPYFWPFKALKWDLRSHTENSVTTSLSES